MKKLFIFIAFLGLIACNSDNDIEIQPNESKETFTLNIKYQDKIYNVVCEELNDSIIFLDKDFESFYLNEIASKPNLATMIHNDGTIEYFENAEVAIRSQKLSLLETDSEENDNQGIMLRKSPYNPVESGASGGKLTLWDDTNYKDRTVEATINFNVRSCTLLNLKHSDGFNDKTSSLKVWSYINNNTTYYYQYLVEPSHNNKFGYASGSLLRIAFIGYENDNLRGRTLICIPPNGGVHEDSNLKRIPCDSGNWNDRISSFEFKIAKATDYTPH